MHAPLKRPLSAALAWLWFAILMVSLSSQAFAVSTTVTALSNSVWTDLGAGPMQLGATGSVVYVISDAAPSNTVGIGLYVPNEGTFPIQTTSHVWASLTDQARQGSAIYSPIISWGGGTTNFTWPGSAALTNYGTAPTGTVPAVNAYVTNSPTLSWPGTSVPATYGTIPTGTVPAVNAYVTDFPATFGVTGTFWQATQPVSGTFWQATQPVSLATAPTTPVTGTFWQATQPVSIASMPTTPVNMTQMATTTLGAPTAWGVVPSGNVLGVNANIVAGSITGTFTWPGTASLTNYGITPTGTVPAVNAYITNSPTIAWPGTAAATNYGTAPVSGTVPGVNSYVTNIVPVSGTFWQATQPVSIATMPSTPVTGTFWQTTQPVSGTITANAGTNLNTSALATDAHLTALGTTNLATDAHLTALGTTNLATDAHLTSFTTANHTDTTAISTNLTNGTQETQIIGNSVVAYVDANHDVYTAMNYWGGASLGAAAAVGTESSGNVITVNSHITGCASTVCNTNISNATSAIATSATNSPVVSYNYGFNGTTWDQLQVDGSKYLKINCVAGCSAGAFNNNADAVATSTGNGQSAAWMYGFNGSTWDRLRDDASKYLYVDVAVLPALASGANTIGAVSQSGTWNIGTVTTLPALVAGSAIIGKVGIDQTTVGTTDAVSLGYVGTTALGTPVAWGSTPSGVVLSANVNCVAGCSSSSAITGWAGGTLGAMSNYGTSPGAVLTPGVNAFVTNTNANGSAVSASSSPVVIASDQAAVAVKAASGAIVAGAIADLAHGQGAMAASVPVVIASNQSSIPVASTLQAGSAIVGKVDVLGNAGGTLDTAAGSAASTGFGIQGLIASGSTATDIPLNTGGRAQSAEPTPVAATQKVAAAYDLVGRQIVFPFANKELWVSGTTAAMTGTASTQVIAGVVSTKLYITHMSCVNSHATVGTFVTVQDGSGGTALATLAAASVFGGDEASGGILFSTTAGNGLFVADVTTGANVICNASGFKGT